MGNLLRRSWSNPNEGDSTPWELPVNQASKWLVARSGNSGQRIQQEGGSVSLTNSSSRDWLLSVFVGDGGSVTLGGPSGANTIQITRTGSAVTVTAQANSGSSKSATRSTTMPLERWANVYLKCRTSGGLNNQVTVSFQLDFDSGAELMATGDFFGNSFATNGKTLSCNSLSGYAWFAGMGGSWWTGWTSTIPISDTRYREAVLNNATWDVDRTPGTRMWYRPSGVRYCRVWAIQGGGGDGTNGSNGSTGNCANGSPGQNGGDGGNDGGAGSAGGPGGSGGQTYENVCESRYEQTGQNCYTDSSGNYVCDPIYEWVEYCEYKWVCHDGSGGSGGIGGAGGRGVSIQIAATQLSAQITVGAAGVTSSSSGVDGGDGGHSIFGGVSTAEALPYSNGRSPDRFSIYGTETFIHGCGNPRGVGGIVFYYKW